MAFEMLYRKYEGPLAGFIYRHVSNKQEAEDVFQEVWLRIITKMKSYRHEDKFKSWLFTIANNLVVENYRGKRHQHEEVKDNIKDENPLPDHVLYGKEMKEWLEKGIKELSFEQRQVYLLRTESDLSFKEIAELIGAPLNTVLTRMHLALGRLRSKYVYEMRRN